VHSDSGRTLADDREPRGFQHCAERLHRRPAPIGHGLANSEDPARTRPEVIGILEQKHCGAVDGQRAAHLKNDVPAHDLTDVAQRVEVDHQMEFARRESRERRVDHVVGFGKALQYLRRQGQFLDVFVGVRDRHR
jgi:hypothetical protein